eukprot:5917243-Amphidinium_carterae.1
MALLRAQKALDLRCSQLPSEHNEEADALSRLGAVPPKEELSTTRDLPSWPIPSFDVVWPLSGSALAKIAWE